MIPRLVAIDGPLSDETIYLENQVVSIGRDVLNDICLKDPYLSRQHCLIRSECDEYKIEDLNSANGTYVNDERVKLSSLEEGALIQIGISLFIFRLQNTAESVALCQNQIESKHRRSLSGGNQVGISRDIIAKKTDRPRDCMEWKHI
jgi:pSer/pThr/pTyr-binding forkhead associated (FHA) protein